MTSRKARATATTKATANTTANATATANAGVLRFAQDDGENNSNKQQQRQTVHE
jgi:hypothetical protein